MVHVAYKSRHSYRLRQIAPQYSEKVLDMYKNTKLRLNQYLLGPQTLGITNLAEEHKDEECHCTISITKFRLKNKGENIACKNSMY